MSDDATAPASRARLPLGVAGSWYDDESVTDEQLAGLTASVERGELPSYSRFVVRKLLREVERRRSLEDSYIVALDQCSIGDLQRAVAEADQLRARLAEIGETREEWGYTQTYPNGTIFTEAECDRDCAERAISRTEQPAKLIRRLAGEWREVPHA